MDEFITLNVGGQLFTTYKATLTDHSAFFKRMFDQSMQPGKTLNGGIFIDRDAAMFTQVLQYLRNQDNWECPSDYKLILDLINEAEFFGLDGMLDKIKERIKPYATSFSMEFYIRHSDASIERFDCCWIPQRVANHLQSLFTEKLECGDVNQQRFLILNPARAYLIERLITFLYNEYRVIYQHQTKDGVLSLHFHDRYDEPLVRVIRQKLYSA